MCSKQLNNTCYCGISESFIDYMPFIYLPTLFSPAIFAVIFVNFAFSTINLLHELLFLIAYEKLIVQNGKA